MKFVLFVEGHTEKKAVASFLKRWLDPRLRLPVGIQTVRFDGWPDMVKDMQRKACLYLEGPEQEQIIAVVALLDLYGPGIYPAHLQTANDRYQWAAQDISRKVAHERFRMFFAVHETEAWLLSKPGLFPREVANRFPGKVEYPETINFNLPPAKLLDSLYYQHLKRHYNKVVLGSNFFQMLDPNDVYRKCPHFAAMMDELLMLAQRAGL